MIEDYESKDFLIKHATYILDHNPISENYVECYKGTKPFPHNRKAHGIEQEIWKEAWKNATSIMITRLVPNKPMMYVPDCFQVPFKNEIVFYGDPKFFTQKVD